MIPRLTIALLFTCTFLFAQQPSTKFGNISEKEWDMEQCEFDSTASAVILMEKCYIHFSTGKAYFRIHKRIKILDDRGMEYGDLRIPYYHNENLEWVSAFKGATYIKNENGKVEKIPAKEEFKEKKNKFWSTYSVPFPAVKKGAIIEYKYEFVTGNLLSLEPWEFQHEIPTVYSKLNFELPNYIQYSILGFGERYQAKYDEKDRKEWVLENLPGYKYEDFVYNPKDYIDQVRFQAFSHLTQQGWEEIVKDWNALGEDILQNHYNRIFRRTKKLEETVNALVAGITSEEERVKTIFDYVRNTYTWNGFYSIYPSRSIDEVIKKKTGNIAGMNLLLIGLLKNAGIKTEPVLISTRTHGKPIRNFPLLNQFDNVICLVELQDGSKLLMDAVNRGGILPYNLLPKEDLNYVGLKVEKGSVNWINIPFSKKSKSQTLIELDLQQGTGTMTLKYKGYPASEKRLDLAEGKPLFEKVILENITGEETNVILNEIIDQKEPEKSLVVKYDLEAPDVSQLETIYFNPGDWSDLKESPFKKEERTLPVELPYPFNYQLALKIKLPEGYQLEDAPEDVALALPSDLGSFNYSVKSINGSVLVNARLKMSGVYMNPSSYFYLKEFYERMSEKINEVLVFGKK